ncbi:MAG: hypothetical protein COA36_15400 [Desulfotalea sp.]|nr:MAG: hypothetical protein COA36_15400 [Desulfotalea sp.]
MVNKKSLIIFSLWVGFAIFLIAVGVFIPTICIEKGEGLIFTVITVSSGVLQSIGTTIFVAVVISCALTTDATFKYTMDRLREIVVSNDYVDKLLMPEKQKLMEAIINPGKQLSSIYSGIYNYYSKHIKKTMEMNVNLYRSHFVLNCFVRFDAEKKILFMEQDMYYRIYKIKGEFSGLLFDSTKEKYTHLESWITDKKGNKEKIDEKNFDNENSDEKIENRQNLDAHQRSILLDREVSIPWAYSENDYLDITRRFVHFGEDDWLLFSYEFPHPTDGLLFNIHCEKGICVKKTQSYGMEHSNYNGLQRSDGITLEYKDWLQEGAGISVLFKTNEKMM